MKKYVIGVDCGTQKAKVVIVNAIGDILGKGSVAYAPPIFPNPGWVEQDPEEWWTKLCNLIRKTIRESGICSGEILACGLSTHRFTKIAVDSQGRPLRNAILWLDSRKVPNFPKGIHFGNLARSDFFLLANEKIIWIKEHEPDVFSKTRKFLGVGGWITYRLTGNFVDSHSSSIADEFMDLQKNDWDDRRLQMFGIPREKLAELVPPGSLLGRVSKDGARDSGLPFDLPVVAGAGDKMCESLGIGVTKSGIASVSCGTLTTIQTITSKFIPKDEFATYSSALPGMWSPEVSSGGFSIVSWFVRQLNWFLDENAKEKSKAQEKLLDKMAANVKPGSSGLLVLPHFHSFYPGWEYYMKGAIIGLDISHEINQLYRSLLEGIAFGVRKSIGDFEKTFGETTEARICGGGASSDVVAQIIADSLGIPVCRTESKDLIEFAGAKGAAIDAANGGGLFESVICAAENMVHVKELIKPNLKTHDHYSKIFEVYKKTSENLQEHLRRLYEIDEETRNL